MSSKLMKNLLCALAAMSLLLGVVSCAKDNSGGGSGGGENKLPVFNFSTRATYALNLNYQVPQGYQVGFEVYAENPLTVDASGRQVKKAGVEPIDKGYTDGNGRYSNRITVPASLGALYIYSQNVGVPPLLVAKVENGTLGEPLPPAAQAGAQSASAMMFSGLGASSMSDYVFDNIATLLPGSGWMQTTSYVKVPAVDRNVLYFGEAMLWGRPDWLSYVSQANFPDASKGAAKVFDAKIYQTINTVLPGEGKGSVDPAVLKSGDINVTKDAEVDLFFIDDACLYMNVLAYYCYPTGNPPASVNDIKTHMIVFPNAKNIRSHFEPVNGTVFDYGALLPGEGVRLHYIDENGVDQGTTFPKGTSIGWVLYSDGYNASGKSGGKVGPRGQISAGYDAIYSDPKLMGGIPHVAVFRHGDFVVTSFEDGKKTSENQVRDYKDVMFHVASTPADAITPGVPDKDPDAPDDKTVVSEVTYRGILAFEDNWPHQGDFDMNDVVVKYVSTVGYNIKNQVLETTDVFTVLWSGAAYNNSFAYKNVNLNAGATVTFEGGDGTSSLDQANQIIRLASNVLDYANASQKKVFTVKTKYSTAIDKSDFVLPPYNPFITVKGDKSKEVHLTNGLPTAFADMSLFGTGKDKSNPAKGQYYITYDKDDNQMPFGIDIAFDSEEEMAVYVIPKELEHINLYYPGFLKWIQSQGKENKDWYLHPVKK